MHLRLGLQILSSDGVGLVELPSSLTCLKTSFVFCFDFYLELIRLITQLHVCGVQIGRCLDGGVVFRDMQSFV